MELKNAMDKVLEEVAFESIDNVSRQRPLFIFDLVGANSTG